MATKRQINAQLKHLKVAHTALNAVNLECISEYANEDDDMLTDVNSLYRNWQNAMYAIDDLTTAFELARHEADDTD